MKNKRIKNIIIGTLMFIALVFLIFRNTYFGYEKYISIYEFVNQRSKTVELLIPKFSFKIEDSENTVSFKTFSSYKIVKKALEQGLLTFEKINCNNIEYFYDSSNDFTILDYGIKNTQVINTGYYRYEFGNHCEKEL